MRVIWTFLLSSLLFLPLFGRRPDIVGCFGLNGPLRQYFSLYRAVPRREGERGGKGQTRVKMSKQPRTRTYCKRSRPLPYYHSNCRTPRHWKFTKHHRTTRPSPARYRLKYCLKGLLNPKQPTNQSLRRDEATKVKRSTFLCSSLEIHLVQGKNIAIVTAIVTVRIISSYMALVSHSRIKDLLTFLCLDNIILQHSYENVKYPCDFTRVWKFWLCQ